MMEDGAIVALYFARNEDAIRETDQKYGKLCYRLADNILHNRFDNEECLNDTYLAVWNQIPPTRPRSLCAFLCRIVRNLSLKRYRRNSAKRRNPLMEASLSELEGVLADLAPDALQLLEAKELAAAIDRFLHNLTYEKRYIFLRRYYFFDPIEVIAGRCSCGGGRIRLILFRLRKSLSKFLREEIA